MARRGKAIFDVSMMTGWALMAGMAVLLVLTMVSDPNDPLTGTASGNGTLAQTGVSDPIDRSVIPSGIAVDPRATAAIPATSAQNPPANFGQRVENNLLKQQNESYNPFDNGTEQQKLMVKLSQQLNELQRRVDIFQRSSGKLRDENRRLRNRVTDLEKMEDRLKAQIVANRTVRIVPLPGSNGDASAGDISSSQQQLAMVRQSDGIKTGIDPQPTGSIRPLPNPGDKGAKFDPFSVESRRDMTLKRQPLNMDLISSGIETPSKNAMRPRPRPATVAPSASPQAMSPVSKVVQTPKQLLAPNRTNFALNLGQFVSLPELRSAWQEVSSSQNQIIGDLHPATSVIQASNNRIHLNLLLGPIQNAAEAAVLCARLKDRGYACSVAPFQGQALVLNR